MADHGVLGAAVPQARATRYAAGRGSRGARGGSRLPFVVAGAWGDVPTSGSGAAAVAALTGAGRAVVRGGGWH